LTNSCPDGGNLKATFKEQHRGAIRHTTIPPNLYASAGVSVKPSSYDLAMKTSASTWRDRATIRSTIKNREKAWKLLPAAETYPGFAQQANPDWYVDALHKSL
jgi:hypothetical protein